MGKAKEPEKLKVIKGDIEYEFEAAEEGGYVASVPLYPSFFGFFRPNLS